METKIDVACIIDDDTIYVNLVRKIIETKHLCNSILVFKNGKEAFEYFEALLGDLTQESIPEIIFLDLNMPVMDGWEFLDSFVKIKHRFDKRIILYVVSSSINPSDIRKAKKISYVTNYLVKPVKIEELVSIFSKKSA